MALTPLKSEITAVAALLQEGDESPEALAKQVLSLIYNQLYPQREVWQVIFELTPGVYAGNGPYPTRAAAMKDLPKLPFAQTCKRGVVASTKSGSIVSHDPPPADRGDFAVIREDARAFKNGWRGGKADRDRFL